MAENWRDSEVQVISPGRWTRLNGTDAEILLPEATAATLIRVRRASADAIRVPAGATMTAAHQHMFTEPDVRDGGAAGELHGWRCACGSAWFPARGERAS